MSAPAPISITFTGLDSLIANFERNPEIVVEEVQEALGKSLAGVEMEAKKRTPVDTGLLQGSIGGEGGYTFIKGLSAGVGTNVVYAGYVESNERAKHKTGEAHYMEHGALAAVPFIKEQFEAAMERIADKLTE